MLVKKHLALLFLSFPEKSHNLLMLDGVALQGNTVKILADSQLLDFGFQMFIQINKSRVSGCSDQFTVKQGILFKRKSTVTYVQGKLTLCSTTCKVSDVLFQRLRSNQINREALKPNSDIGYV